MAEAIAGGLVMRSKDPASGVVKMECAVDKEVPGLETGVMEILVDLIDMNVSAWMAMHTAQVHKSLPLIQQTLIIFL